MFQTMWTFSTANFTVVWKIHPSTDLDLSWDDDGSVTAGIEDGRLLAFDSVVTVEHNGEEIGADYLGASIYADPSDFRDHIGTRGQHMTYFKDMVHEAIQRAREHLLDTRSYVRPNAVSA